MMFQNILNKRYGLNDGVRYTLEQIAKETGVSRERIRQKENKALYLLRRKPALRKYIMDDDDFKEYRKKMERL